jgi:hypothetical protein
MKAFATFIRCRMARGNFWVLKDRRAAWLYLLFFVTFLFTCKVLHIDPQAPQPAILVSTVSLLALLKM